MSRRLKWLLYLSLIIINERAFRREDVDIKDDPDGDDKGVKKRKKMKSIDPKDMTEEQLLERR